MWVYGQSQAVAIDLVGIEVRQNQTSEGVPFFIIAGFTYYGGDGFLLGSYTTREQALVIFNDILGKMQGGELFYNVKENEEILIRTGKLIM